MKYKQGDRRRASAVPASVPDGRPAAAQGPDPSTRARVADSILRHGPSTAAQLADRLGLTPAAVRRHLDGLLVDGWVEAREQRVYRARGRGRPAKVFALTDLGRGQFHTEYDTLAVSAMEYLGSVGGEEAVRAFAERRVAEAEQRYRDRVDGRDEGVSAAQALAQALTDDGYAASTRAAAHGEQLCQHNCPVAHVAERFPELCEAETEAFSRLLGVRVQRLATIAHGDGVCTTHVPTLTDHPDPQLIRSTPQHPHQRKAN